jgi:hypothetical protein
MEDLGEAYLTDVLASFRKLKSTAERAVAQVRDEHFFATVDPESNSIAVVMKHMAGNLRSRWTDFLTSDGEKPDRHRDHEFELGAETRVNIEAQWSAGWQILFEALEPLTADDLQKIVQIRGEPHTVLQAINRQLTHYAYHVGQIVLLAKHHAGSEWRTLSIPHGQSEAYNARMFTSGSA